MKQLYESEFPVAEDMIGKEVWCDYIGMNLIPVESKTQLELRQLLRQVIEDNRHIRERLEASANDRKLLKEGMDISKKENERLFKDWCDMGDDKQNLIEHLKAIIQAWEEDDDIVVNTGIKIREAKEYLKSRNK